MMHKQINLTYFSFALLTTNVQVICNVSRKKETLETGETTLAFASHEMGEMNLGGKYSKANINKEPFGIELAFVTEIAQISLTLPPIRQRRAVWIGRSG